MLLKKKKKTKEADLAYLFIATCTLLPKILKPIFNPLNI